VSAFDPKRTFVPHQGASAATLRLVFSTALTRAGVGK